MLSVYEQVARDHGVDPVASTEYLNACDRAWHYARLYSQTMQDMTRLGEKPGLVADAARRAQKCELALQEAYELSYLGHPFG